MHYAWARPTHNAKKNNYARKNNYKNLIRSNVG